MPESTEAWNQRDQQSIVSPSPCTRRHSAGPQAVGVHRFAQPPASILAAQPGSRHPAGRSGGRTPPRREASSSRYLFALIYIRVFLCTGVMSRVLVTVTVLTIFTYVNQSSVRRMNW